MNVCSNDLNDVGANWELAAGWGRCDHARHPAIVRAGRQGEADGSVGLVWVVDLGDIGRARDCRGFGVRDGNVESALIGLSMNVGGGDLNRSGTYVKERA